MAVWLSFFFLFFFWGGVEGFGLKGQRFRFDAAGFKVYIGAEVARLKDLGICREQRSLAWDLYDNHRKTSNSSNTASTNSVLVRLIY